MLKEVVNLIILKRVMGICLDLIKETTSHQKYIIENGSLAQQPLCLAVTENNEIVVWLSECFNTTT